MDKIIGRNLKMLREAHGFTQDQMSSFLNIKRSAYSNYELGEREMPLNLLEASANLLGCDLSLFFDENVENVRTMMTCAFRVDDLAADDLVQIAEFKLVVKNYLKMNRLLELV